jgi:putative nucleotidyltransferase with HDIG domain
VSRLRLLALTDALGCRLARAIRDDRGRVLLAEGVVLTRTMLRALRARGYRAVAVVNELAPDVLVDEALQDETRLRAEQVVRDVLRRSLDGERIDTRRVSEAVDAIINDLQRNPDVVFSLATLRSVDDHTFVHSVNVCTYCLIMARGLGYDRGDLRRLGTGAILHDIGKVRYRHLIERRGPLTPEEFEQVKRHTVDGYEMLRRQPGIDLLSAHVALQHHERLDGSGYPRGLAGEEIHPFARLAAVADVYDAITADRPYRSASPPHEAMAALQEMAGRLLDPGLVRQLAQRLAVYPNGTLVRLSDGCLAVVVGQGASGPWPRVRVLTDEALTLVSPYEVETGPGAQFRQVRAVLHKLPSAVRAQLNRTAAV